MRKGLYWVVRLVVLAIVIKALLWLWHAYDARNPSSRAQEVPDVDKVCSVIADTGQCFCHHRQTDQRLTVPYRECTALAARR